METTKTRINDLAGNIQEYIETRIDIVKLDAVDTGASAASSMVSWALISIIAFITLFLLTIGGAIAIGYMLENFAYGFLILAGFYMLVAIVIYANRENWIRKPLVKSIVKNIYEND